MKTTTARFIFFTLSVLYSAEAKSQSHPFPQHTNYTNGAILPSHHPRQTLDDSVRTAYTRWKKRYIRHGCGKNEYYVWFENTEKNENKQCVSEGQGYGMLVTALMAGYDPQAQSTFDGLLRYTRSHASQRSPFLMSWAQKKNCANLDGTTAPDGDLDIAYSLLLAAAQWGQNGPINYQEEARHMIDAIAAQEINHNSFSVVLSNSIDPDGNDYGDMRSSDFMPAHFKAFLKATHDPTWQKAIDNNYNLFASLQHKYSPEAGLIPDFITKSKPAHPNYLETRYDGAYYFNACRVPWRLASDFLISGDPRAATILAKINRWIRSTTRNNPDNISAGYNLAGQDLPKHNYEALCFIGPFAVAAMIDPQNQPWLDKCWDYLTAFPARDFDYYDNSIRLIDMIILSGNYWTP